MIEEIVIKWSSYLGVQAEGGGGLGPSVHREWKQREFTFH